MRAAIFSFSARGAELSKKVAEYLHSIGYETELQTVAKYAEQTGIAPMLPDHNGACAAVFNKCQALVTSALLVLRCVLSRPLSKAS